MRRYFSVALLPLSFFVHAALPESTGVPALDARLPELQARLKMLDGNRQTLAQRPTAAARWDCDVPRMAVLGVIGFTDKQHDPVAWSNFSRANYGVNSDITAADIVPLSGACSNGRLEGAVSFWYQVDLQMDSQYFKGTSRTYGQASMTLTTGKPATDIRHDSLSLTLTSNSKDVKASDDLDDGPLSVSWKNLDDAGKHVPGLESLSVARSMKMSGTRRSIVWTIRQAKSPDTIESAAYLSRYSPIRHADRYDDQGSLVERQMGGARLYLTADGNWTPEAPGAAKQAAGSTSSGTAPASPPPPGTAYLGVALTDIAPERAQTLNLKDNNGALVNQVIAGSPAEQAGILAGDVILKFSGAEVSGANALTALVRQSRIGEHQTMELVRGGKPLSLSVTPQQAPPTALAGTAPAIAPQSVTPIEGNSGRYLSPFTSDGVAAAWVDKAINASLGSSLGGMAGAYAGQKALEQVPFIGGFLGQKAGAAAGRGVALRAVGGEAYLRETSDLSFDNINDMAKWLVQTHASHAKFTEIMKAAGQIYPELTPAYMLALRQR